MLAHETAKHHARLHIETGDIERAVGALDGTPPLVALDFLFNLATAYRNVDRFKDVGTVMEVADLIDRDNDIS